MKTWRCSSCTNNCELLMMNTWHDTQPTHCPLNLESPDWEQTWTYERSFNTDCRSCANRDTCVMQIHRNGCYCGHWVSMNSISGEKHG